MSRIVTAQILQDFSKNWSALYWFFAHVKVNHCPRTKACAKKDNDLLSREQKINTTPTRFSKNLAKSAQWQSYSSERLESWSVSTWPTRFFSYKNELYKNVEAENCRKFKNVLRMFRGSNSNQHKNLSMNLHKIWWCLLHTLHFYAKTILNTALYTSLYYYRYIEIHIPLSICPSNWNRKSLDFLLVYTPENRGLC
jgi:hypothetical protein